VCAALKNIEAGGFAKLLRLPLQLLPNRQRKCSVGTALNQMQGRQQIDGLRIAIWESTIDQHQSIDIGSPSRRC
jgi:hypothetical protein